MEMLPTTSETERELWLRTNDLAQKFLGVMKSYAEEIIEECSNSVDEEDIDDSAPRAIVDTIRKGINNVTNKI